MASTNKTTHYELSQYIGTDKPTYLTDYNQDMSRIDAGIYGAKAEADTNASSIGTLSNLTTTAKTDLVSAINELDGEVATNTGNISTNTTNIDANTTAIGVLTNLTTSAKNNLVSAINEVDANCDSNTSNIGNLSTLETTNKTNIVSAVNEIVNFLNINHFDSVSANDITLTVAGNSIASADVQVAYNDSKSLAKIYGTINIIGSNNDAGYIRFPSALRPDTDLVINGQVIMNFRDAAPSALLGSRSLTIKTDGTIEIPYNGGQSGVAQTQVRIFIANSLLFIKDFGDVPIPE